MNYPLVDLGSYSGPRDLSPAHVQAILNRPGQQQDAHVEDWSEHLLTGPYADMLIVEAPALKNSPAFKVISSKQFAEANYDNSYTKRPMTLVEMWAAERGDDLVARDLSLWGTTE